jgi:DNA polymerase-3 subunit delta
MPDVSAGQVLRALAKGTRGGVFFLHGEEEYLKEEAARAIIDAHLDPASRDFNLDPLRGTSLDPEMFASACATPPMMADWRVVVVRDAQAIAVSARLRSVVESVVARPVPGLALVIVAHLPEKGRARFWEQLRKNATSIPFTPLSQADLPGWLIARAEEQGFQLDTAAARALGAALGSELGTLTRELDKLRDYAGDRRKVTRDDVQSIVGVIPHVIRWDWFDSVGERRFDDARRALPALLGTSESGVGLIIGLGTHLIRIGIAAAGGANAVAEVLPPYQRWLAKRIAAQARGWAGPAIDDAIDDLLRADRLLKSTPLGELQILEEMLLRMRGRTAEAA